MVGVEEAGLGEGDKCSGGADGVINSGGSRDPDRGWNSAEEMVAPGVDKKDEEEEAFLDGAAVEGGEDGVGASDVGHELLEPRIDERQAADG